jgi:hypothetical protein
MAKKPKTLDEEVEDIIEVDILGMEMEQGLPHWLDPIERYKHKYDEDRRQKQIERSNKIMSKGKKKK